MKKVIVKAKVQNREKFEKKLAEVEMKFPPVYYQHDRVYVPRGYKRGMNLPRLVMRTEIKSVDKPAKYSLLLKRHIEDSGIDYIEETSVKDYAEMVNIILQLGFKLQKEVSKRRQMIEISDDAVLYLDHLDNGGGLFTKLEAKLLEGDSVELVKADLTKTLAVFGEKEIIPSAYFED